MWTLLHYAGVTNHRPWWDPFLLLFGALLWIAITLATFFAFLRKSNTLTTMQWMEVFTVIVPMTILMSLGARRIQRWELDQEIERCRTGFGQSQV
jgi:membrane protein DedA with SNARE-associated domain